MAGAGYKLFATGDVLTASDVNTYLMQQTVMVFADAAARTTALSGVVAEGMLSYLKDTNAVEVYDGANWVASDDPNAIQNTIVDAKGDLITATGADVPARLAVGSNGDTLVADSAATVGLRYSAIPSASNPLINSAYDVWQRGTSIAGQEKYTADRWYKIRGSDVTGQTVSRQVTGDTTNLPSIQYCARVQRDSGNSSTNEMYFFQSMETSTSIPFVGKTVTFSFYARKGSNYSSTSDALKVYLTTGTGTDEAKPYAYTGATNAIDQTATLTATWQRFSYSATLSASATQIGVQLRYTPTGTASTNDYFEVTGTQIDIGSVALPYRRSSVTLQGELAACQRYFYRTQSNGNRTVAWGGNIPVNNLVVFNTQFPVTMRGTPTFNSGTAASLTINYGGNLNIAAATIVADVLGTDISQWYITASGTPFTTGGAARIYSTATTGWVEFSAEL
jgi:hypothetical protein